MGRSRLVGSQLSPELGQLLCAEGGAELADQLAVQHHVEVWNLRVRAADQARRKQAGNTQQRTVSRPCRQLARVSHCPIGMAVGPGRVGKHTISGPGGGTGLIFSLLDCADKLGWWAATPVSLIPMCIHVVFVVPPRTNPIQSE